MNLGSYQKSVLEGRIKPFWASLPELIISCTLGGFSLGESLRAPKGPRSPHLPHCRANKAAMEQQLNSNIDHFSALTM